MRKRFGSPFRSTSISSFHSASTGFDLFRILFSRSRFRAVVGKHQLNGYKLHLNSYGRGKGLAVYYKDNIFQPIQDCQREFLQITVIKSKDLTVVGLYRSAGDRNLAADLKKVVPTTGPCLVIGDFNICSAKSPNHEVFKSLKSMGFKLLTQEATHFEGGHIDQAWLKSNSTSNIQLYSPYYTCKDHDGLLFTIQGAEKGSILCLLF